MNVSIKKIIIYTVVFVVILAATFFIGRCTKEDFTRENIELKNSLEQSREEVGRLKSTISRLDSEVEKIGELQSRLIDLNRQLKTRSEELGKLQKELAAGNTEAGRLVGEIESIIFN